MQIKPRWESCFRRTFVPLNINWFTFEDREAIGGAFRWKITTGIDECKRDGDELEVEALLGLIQPLVDHTIDHSQ